MTPPKRHEESEADKDKSGSTTKKRAITPVREQFPTAKQWQEISPKYEQPKPEPPKAKLPDMNHPRDQWKGANEHKALAASLGFESVTPKFRDHFETMQPEDSPRRRVERAREHESSLTPGRPWQSTTKISKLKTFDDMLSEYYKAHVELAPPAPGASKISQKSLSSVGEYIRSGTPIRHNLGTTEPRDRVHRHRSPVPFRSPGVKEDTFAAAHVASRKRPEFAMEEARVREDRQARATKVVPKNHTPRVAKMAPAYAIAHIPDGGAESDSSSPQRGRSTSATRQ
jgi:hypothetical protein